ncbi:hypothetical protein BJX68DRAFT_69821 [Aspergillus pseudodeflectus]|uniref:Uncharacterized protein n=1 Tax=Aspergillus pseudodeflectus TaxID=176178 RepID=A0ABR4KG79_9EURO
MITTWRCRGPCQVLPRFIKPATDSTPFSTTHHLGRSSPQQELNPTPNSGMQSVLHPILGPKKRCTISRGALYLLPVVLWALGPLTSLLLLFYISQGRTILTRQI